MVNHKIKRILEDIGIEKLRPPQERVINEGLLNKNQNFLISIPTASGKTLIGEIAILNHVLDDDLKPTDKKGIFIVPLKALATEKYEDFKKKYEKYGLNIGLSIGDFDEDEDLSNYHIIITTSEKLDSILRRGVDWINKLSIVVIDEIHLIGDDHRGGTLEVLLTKLKSNYKIQIIGLSATVGNPEDLSNWLNGKLVVDNWRPVKLKKGMGYKNRIVYIDESGKTIEEKKLKIYDKDGLTNIILDCINREGSCLVFCNSKNNAVNSAKKFNLKKYAPKYLNTKKLNEISEEVLSVLDNPTSLCRSLAECIKNGVAFHHAGLTYQQRKIIEDGFRNKYIKVIFCTPTLSAGINMPCRMAIVKNLKRYSENGYVNIPKMEIRQCIGRAGRPNLDPYGEGIIYMDSSVKEDVAKDYLIGNVEPIFSKLSNERVLRSHILGLISTGDISTERELMDFIKETYYGYIYGNFSAIEEKIKSVVRFLKEGGFLNIEVINDFNNDFNYINNINNKNNKNKNNINKNNIKINQLSLGNDGNLKITSNINNGKRYIITTIGKLVSNLYIDPLSAKIIIDGLKYLDETYGDLDSVNKYIMYILYTISKTTELRPTLYVNKHEIENLYYEMSDLDIYEDDYEDLKYYKTAKLLYSWIDEVSEEDILQMYSIEPGVVRYKVEQAKWIIHSTKEILKHLDIKMKSKLMNILNSLEVRMIYGCREELINLLSIKHIGRVRGRLLYNSGIKSIEDIKNNPAKVESILGSKISKKIFSELNINYGQTKLL